jgi:hypothetical protein
VRHTTTLVMLAFAIGLLGAQVASANRISTSNRRFRATFTPFHTEDENGANVVDCDVTLEGSLHSATFAKVGNALIGQITRAEVNRLACNGGAIWLLNGTERIGMTTTTNTLPWHVRFVSYQGALPTFTGVTIVIIGFSMLVDSEEIADACLYASTTIEPYEATFNVGRGGVVSGLRNETATGIPFVSGGPFCWGTYHVGGQAIVRVLGSTTTGITLTLI